ncbi:MAG: hypothetical protein ACLGRW_07075 [Acidobacteriota bacterium]
MNSPGPDAGDAAGGCAAGGAALGAAGSVADAALIVLNIWVKLPGEAGLTGSAVGFFSIETWLKTRASSSDGFAAGGLDGAVCAGVVNACNIRVNSPGLEEAAGAACCTEGGFGAAGVCCSRARDASRSSSVRVGGGETVPKIPVALDDPSPEA